MKCPRCHGRAVAAVLRDGTRTWRCVACGWWEPQDETPGLRGQIEALKLDEPISDADDAAWNRALDAVLGLLDSR